MKKFVLIPDSFKGTMSSQEICDIMEEKIKIYEPDAEIRSIPVADGGEGSVDALLAGAGGRKVSVDVKGPYREETHAFYGVLKDGTAVIEMAACAGLPLVEGNMHPERATTFGVGQLLVHVASHGCGRIIIGLGGSCTNDGGAGAAAAAGVKFYNEEGREFLPTGGSLRQIRRIDASGLLPSLRRAEIVAMCDIDNPLYGRTGAAYVFAPQKGADDAMVAMLDDGLWNLAETVKRDLQVDISALPGAGAAGGMGGGVRAFFGAKLQKGIDTVLDAVKFDDIARDADLVFTGEGKIDTQSLRGKVVIGVAHRTQKLHVPLVAVVGDIGDDIGSAYEMGVSAIFSINRVAKDFSEVRRRSKSDMALTVDNLMRFMRRMGL